MAVVTLTPYKTLGEDGIYPVLLQEGIMLLIGPLYNITTLKHFWVTYRGLGRSQER